MTVNLKRTAIFTFGRMNPPTVGHSLLVRCMKEYIGDHYLFLSHTVNNKTDPIPYEIKKHYVELFFPDVFVGHDSVTTIIQALQHLESLEYTDVIMIVGSDRVKGFSNLLTKYNNVEYCFDSVCVLSAGIRDPDANGVESVSASRQREYVLTGNRKAFAIGVPNDKYTDNLYDAVELGLSK